MASPDLQEPKEVHATGLSVLVDPKIPALDIVFVHGFTGHPERTWTHKGEIPNNRHEHHDDDDDDDDGGGGDGERPPKFRKLLPSVLSPHNRIGVRKAIYWPRDLVPITVPNARILAHGYDTHIRHRLGSAVNKSTIYDIAWDFLVSLEAARRSEPWRPLLFIAHSLGGIVVKEALRRSRGCEMYQSHLRAIYESTSGIIFFGTPHGGADPRGPIQHIAEKCIRAAGFSVGEQIVNTLLPSSERLRELREEFGPMARRRNWIIYSFQEQYGIKALNGNKVVDDAASCLNDPEIEVAQHIAGNHMDMCRFSGPDDAEYGKVSAALSRVLHATGKLATSAVRSVLDVTQRRIYLDSLSFNQIDARHATITTAHAKTCTWLLSKSEYQEWLDAEKISEHHGFLWIKGKPGTGKSTIMKFAFANAKRKFTDAIVISFFFNVRGEDLEKSVFGMYRSLLFQLLEKVPDLQSVFDSLGPPMSNNLDFQWNIEDVQKLFGLAIERLGQRSLTCFIDALDECEEDQVREMLAFFEQLGKLALSSRFLVCFSSRHYPHITIRKGIQLILDHQDGHQQDIAKYLHGKLKVGHSKLVERIKVEILERASGIFLWVVLVVQLLNKEYDRGRIHALRKRLNEIPNGLDELFKDILTRDSQNLEELILCLQWILYARRPLKCEELYFALLVGMEPEVVSPWSPEEIDRHVMERFILSSSKGLAELTNSKHRTVQFIHESVRDFLLRGNGLNILQSQIGSNFGLKTLRSGTGNSLPGLSHERLKQCCQSHINLDVFNHLPSRVPNPAASPEEAANVRQLASQKFPFLEYAVHNVLHHADAANGYEVPQDVFVEKFPLKDWITLDNFFERYPVRHHTSNASLLYILAEENLPNLIRVELRRVPHMDIKGELYGFPLHAALACTNEGAVRALLMPITDTGSGFDMSKNQSLHPVFAENQEVISRLLKNGRDISSRKDRSLLWHAIELGDFTLAKVLLATRKVDINCQNNHAQTPLSWAVENGHEAMVKLLLDNGADPEYKGEDSRTPLSYGIEKSHEVVAKPLSIATEKNISRQPGVQGILPNNKKSTIEQHPQTDYHSNSPAVVQTGPLTDSGYASLSHNKCESGAQNAREKDFTYDIEGIQSVHSTDEVTEKPELDENQSDYTEGPSIPALKRQKYISELADDLFKKVHNDWPDGQTMERICKILPRLLKAFSLKVAHNPQSETAMHRNVMVFVRRYRSEIVRCFRDRYSDEDEGESRFDILVSDANNMTLKDRMDDWYQRTEPSEDSVPLDYQNEKSEQSGLDDLTDEDPTDGVGNEDIDFPELAEYRDFISSNPAYKWLVESIRREFYLTQAEPNLQDAIRQKIMDSLPSSQTVSRRHSPETYKVIFMIEWDPLTFVKEQEYGGCADEAVEKAITITGNPKDAEALTCVQYLCQTWPSVGIHTLRVVKDAIRRGLGHRYEGKLPDNTKLTAWINKSTFTVEALGVGDSVAEVGEQLAWLGSALRSSPYSLGVAYCTPYVSEIYLENAPRLELEMPPEIFCKIGFRLCQEDNLETSNGQCWHNMFRNPVVVKGYPIPRRDMLESGLEIPLNMMAGLAQTRCINTFNGKIFIKGFSTMLIPTKYSEDLFIWHLLYNENGNRISYLDNTIPHAENINLSNLEKSRHVLGWCSDVRNYAGALHANYKVNRSWLPGPHPGCILEKVSVSGGKLITGGDPYADGNRDRPHHISRNDYRSKLLWISKKFIVLWDEEDMRGWLINGTSALLHLLRGSLECNRTDGFKSTFLFKPEKMKEASISYTADSAVEVLGNPANLNLEIYLEGDRMFDEQTGHKSSATKNSHVRLQHRVEYLYGILEKLIDHQIAITGRNGEKLKCRSRKYLEGWDFKDLATDEDPLYPRVATLKTIGKGWVDFIRTIHAVTLFGSGFGEIIQPVDVSNSCAYWATLPKGKFYLAVCVSDLAKIIDRFGKPKANPIQLTDHINWHHPDKIFEPCQCSRGQKEHSNLAQVLLPASFHPIFPNCNQLQLKGCGAVIFGHNPDIGWFWNDTGDPEEGGPPSPPEEPEALFNDSGIGGSLGSSRFSESYLRQPSTSALVTKSLTHEHYNVGIVCALHKELLVVRALFDSKHQNLNIASQDTNRYALGCIENYNVVAACLPYDDYGTNSAANVASHMIRSFPGIRFCLVVGIGGGVPSPQNDIRLGDVVVGTGVIQYNLGKALQNSVFKQSRFIQRPPRALMTAISELNSDPLLSPTPLQEYIKVIETLRPEYKRPGKEHDILFAAKYVHDPTQETCERCDGTRIKRNPRPWDHLRIHYGLIGSGDQVVKDAELRDSLSKDSGILCVEMEAAGVMKTMHCLVIRGICDYADSHKNNLWQEHAAASAAAYAKFFLSRMRNSDVLARMPAPSETPKTIHLPKRAVSFSQPETSLNKRQKL